MSRRRAGGDEEEDEGQSPILESNSSYVSPGMQKKAEFRGYYDGQEGALGGWVPGKGLFGNAVKLFENVGDAALSFVAPLPEDDESFNIEDSFEREYQHHNRVSGSEQEEFAGEEKQKLEHGDGIDEETDVVKTEQPKSAIQSPQIPLPSSSVPNPGGGSAVLPLSAPSVDPKFLSGNYGSTASQQANQEAVAGTAVDARHLRRRRLRVAI